jgi:hypothetical protein
MPGLGQVEAVEQLRGAALGVGPAEVEQPAHHDQVLRAGQGVVDGDVLAGQPDQGADPGRLLDDVVAGTLARPELGASRVARIRTVVVLPDPLGPSSPSTVPVGTVRSMPSSALVAPNDLARPSAWMASVMETPFCLAGPRGFSAPDLRVRVGLPDDAPPR